MRVKYLAQEQRSAPAGAQNQTIRSGVQHSTHQPPHLFGTEKLLKYPDFLSVYYVSKKIQIMSFHVFNGLKLPFKERPKLYSRFAM